MGGVGSYFHGSSNCGTCGRMWAVGRDVAGSIGWTPKTVTGRRTQGSKS